jgi:hypothetical protein
MNYWNDIQAELVPQVLKSMYNYEAKFRSKKLVMGTKDYTYRLRRFDKTLKWFKNS